MSDLQAIEELLQRTASRRRMQQGWRGLWQGFLVGAIAWLAALALYKVAPVPIGTLGLAGVFAGLSMAVGFIVGWSRKFSLAQAARWLDSRQGLKERLSTALEISHGTAAEEWKALVVTDAAQRLPEVNPSQLLPWRLPAAARWSVLVLVVAAGLGFVPEYRTQKFVQRSRDTAAMKESGQRLLELARRNLEARPPALETTRQSLESVAELGDHLAKAQLTRAEALKDLSSVAEKLKEQMRELGRNPAFQSMEKAARSVERGGTPGSAELQKQIDSLQKALSDQAKDPNALDKFKKDVQSARETAANMPDKDSPGGAEAAEKLTQTLSNLSRQATDMGLSLPALEEAIAALAASQTDQLVRDLKTTEIELEKLQAMAKALQELQAQADKVGKDLPEQLELGQAEAAQSTLSRMAEMLKKAGLDSEELKRLSEEIGRAVHPASQYGKVSQLLKQASQKMDIGQKSEAARDLNEAASELQTLMKEMGDAQSMMASLDALQQAQMAIANGQSWSQSKSQPRAGRGGGIGSGVGTWAENEGRLMDINDIKDRWDNSGVVREDEDPRGIADRGDAQLADNLAPTKIKGQIKPGGPMPSITLKGVSIKGMSRVQVEEASTAAQSAAQSALSQEQVPRAYRGAVRDYFDDLKK